MPDLRFYMALFLRRLPYVLILTVAGLAIGTGLALTLPPEYEANARLVVESEQIPGDLATSTVRIAATEQLQIIEQRIKARDTLLDMANRLNIYQYNDQSDGPMRPDEIVSDLRRRVIIRTTGGTQRRGESNALLVGVKFSAPNPDLAADVVNEVVTLIRQENQQMRTGVSGDTLDFFIQEERRLSEKLAQQGQQIIRFQEGNRDALAESLPFRRNQLLAAQEELIELAEQELGLTERRDTLVATFEQTGLVDGLEDDGLQNFTPEERRLRELQARLADSVAVLSLDNPRVRVLKAQIESLEALVEQQASVTGAASQGAASARSSMFDLQVAEVESQLEFLQNRREQLETEMAALQASIEATPANAIALDTLERDYQTTRTLYDETVKKRAEAERGDIIEVRGKSEQITLLDAAVAPDEPTSPNRPRLVAMGAGAGLMAAFAFVGLLELLNTSIRRSQDITRQLEITPFGTLPFIRTRRDVTRRRLLILLALVLIVGVGVGGLWGVNEFVMPLDLILRNLVEFVPGLAL